MNGHPWRVGILIAAAGVAVAAGGTTAAGADEHTVRVVAPWEGRARVYITGRDHAFLLGAFSGRVTAEPDASPLNGAQLVCPGAFDADYVANMNRGEGRCVLTTRSGERLFARWSCAGEPDKGCAGRFVFTGGTGAYEGIAGEGELALELTVSEVTHLDQTESAYDVKGLATWPALRYRTP